MYLKTLLNTCFFLIVLTLSAQKSTPKKISCAEKWWVIKHPFVAKKAYRISMETRKITAAIKKDSLLIGDGNGLQVDAFRHTYWMVTLTQSIGWRRAKSLGKAHEKGNYQDYKKRRNEDGVIPDQISSEMDLFNNSVGIEIAQNNKSILDFKLLVISAVKSGKCKIIKTNVAGNYLDINGEVIPKETLKGKWKNEKCLVDSNTI